MMMNLFRSGGLGQWIVASVASLVIVVFVVEFRAARGPASAKVTNDCAIRMPGVCVPSKDFYAAYGLVVPPGVSSKQIKAMKLPEQILEGLVERELLVAKAAKEGIGIGSDDLESQLMQGRAYVSLPVSMSQMLGAQLGLCPAVSRMTGCAASAPTMRLMAVRRSQDDRFDTKKYEREVRIRTNRGPKQFRELQERELIAARMRDLIRGSVRVSREEAFAQFQKQASHATVQYVTIDRDWYAKNVANLSDKAVQAWADAHKDAVDELWKNEKDKFVAGCPLVSEIAMPFDSEVTDAQKVDLRKKIDEAYTRLTKGKETFETVARDLSQSSSAGWGGSVGCLTEATNPAGKELLEALASVKPHQVSPVIETTHGFYILRSEGTLAAEDLEKTGRLQLARQNGTRAIIDEGSRAYADGIIKAVKSGASLDAAVAQELQKVSIGAGSKASAETAKPEDTESSAPKAPKVVTSSSFTPEGSPGPDFSPFSGIGPRVFTLDKPGAVLDTPVLAMRGPAVVVLVSKDLASREEFDKHADELLRELQEQKGQAALEDTLARLRRAQAGKIEVAAEYKNMKIRGSED
jgi:peptidyl-prolyl cis-trans isomerase D